MAPWKLEQNRRGRAQGVIGCRHPHLPSSHPITEKLSHRSRTVILIPITQHPQTHFETLPPSIKGSRHTTPPAPWWPQKCSVFSHELSRIQGQRKSHHPETAPDPRPPVPPIWVRLVPRPLHHKTRGRRAKGHGRAWGRLYEFKLHLMFWQFMTAWSWRRKEL